MTTMGDNSRGRGRPPQWTGKALSADMVREFASRLDECREELVPVKDNRSEYMRSFKERGFPVKPLTMAMAIRDVSRDEGDRVEFVRQLNFALEVLGVSLREQPDFFEGEQTVVKMSEAG